MNLRILLWMLMPFVLVGCASTQQSTNLRRMQVRINDLERKVEEKDRQIVELKYDIKDLTMKMDDQSTPIMIEEPVIEYERHFESPSVSTKTTAKSNTKDLIRVDVKPDVVQSALKKAGYYSGTIDGKIGRQSKKAIMQFQKDHALVADGIVGMKTWQQLKQYL